MRQLRRILQEILTIIWGQNSNFRILLQVLSINKHSIREVASWGIVKPEPINTFRIFCLLHFIRKSVFISWDLYIQSFALLIGLWSITWLEPFCSYGMIYFLHLILTFYFGQLHILANLFTATSFLLYIGLDNIFFSYIGLAIGFIFINRPKPSFFLH